MSLKRPFVLKSDVKQWFTTTTVRHQFLILWALNYYYHFQIIKFWHPCSQNCFYYHGGFQRCQFNWLSLWGRECLSTFLWQISKWLFFMAINICLWYYVIWCGDHGLRLLVITMDIVVEFMAGLASLYLGYAQIYWVFNGTLNLLFLASFCKTLFLPECLSNQLEILTQHSQCSQEGWYDFSKTPIVFFRNNPGFSGSLYSWMAKDSFCLLGKWADTALCCSSNAKGSICLLVKWADTAFWLARQ